MSAVEPATTINTALDAALRYGELGLRVVPIKPGHKRPALDAWQNVATTDPAAIRAWWEGLYRDHGVGLALGEIAPGRWVFAIDIDGESHGVDGETGWADLCADYGYEADTVEAITGGGGRHLLLWADVEVTNAWAKNLPEGIDVRGAGGQIVVEPTVHPSGQAYAWVDGHAPWETKIAQAPGWLVAKMAPVEPTPEPAPPVLAEAGERPGDLWAAQTPWSALLERDGWTLHHSDRDGEQHWTRPGKERREGTSATVGYKGSDVLKVFTSSVPSLNAEETYSKIGYLAATRHGGDISAAASWLRSEGFHAQPKAVDLDWIGEATVEGAQDSDEPERHGWEPLDLTDVLSDGYVAPVPELCRRNDGRALFYRGRICGLIGESNSGKSWVSQYATAQVLVDGGAVLVVDLEDHMGSYVARLRALGATKAALLERFFYISPERALNVEAQVALDELVEAHGIELAVIDSTGESMSLEGVKPNEDDEVARWFRILPRRLSRRGVSVVLLDHLPKDSEAGKTSPIGSQRKKAAIDGTMFRVDVGVAPAKGVEGHLKLVCVKDRSGHWQPGSKVADVTIVDRNGGTDVILAAPVNVDRPTVLMERVSRYLETNGPTSRRTTEKDVTGKANVLRTAIDVLVLEDWVEMRPRTGRGAGWDLVSIRPFRDDESTAWIEHSHPTEDRTICTPADEYFAANPVDNQSERLTASPASQPRPHEKGRGSEMPQNRTASPVSRPSVNRAGQGRGSEASDEVETRPDPTNRVPPSERAPSTPASDGVLLGDEEDF